MPQILEEQIDEIKKIIEETFISYGMKGLKPSQLLGVRVEINTKFEFV